jgi:acyl-CoA synthetase (AMP-forming)/AMP-acid ligase II
MLVPDLLQAAADKHPDRNAVVVIGVDAMSYGAWAQGANRLAHHFVRQGLQPGDRVGLLLGNEDATVYLQAYAAIHTAGGVAVPCNTGFSPSELAHVLTHSGALMVVVGLAHAATLTETAVDLVHVLSAQSARSIGQEGDCVPLIIERAGDELADILYTSGTTGRPKGVACTHDNISFKGASTLSQAFAGAHFLHAVPLFTFAGTHAMSLICLRGGMTQVILPRFEAGAFLDALVRYKVQLSYAVPAMILRMLAHEQINQGGFDSLKLLMFGTAPMPPAAILALSKKLPNTFLLNLYGLTEGGAAVCSLPPHEVLARPNSIGRPLPPTEVRITDPGGVSLPPNSVGEIGLRAPIRQRWYYQDEAATAETWDTDGWLKTGDLGYLDDDGYLYLVDRIKDLIIVGGHNVSAPEVESVLIEHACVRDAAVVGVPHPIMGEVPKGFVVLRAGTSLCHETLQTHLRARLAAYKVPRQVEVVPALPRNALGKVLKRVLRGEAAGAEAQS